MVVTLCAGICVLVHMYVCVSELLFHSPKEMERTTIVYLCVFMLTVTLTVQFPGYLQYSHSSFTASICSYQRRIERDLVATSYDIHTKSCLQSTSNSLNDLSSSISLHPFIFLLKQTNKTKTPENNTATCVSKCTSNCQAVTSLLLCKRSILRSAWSARQQGCPAVPQPLYSESHLNPQNHVISHLMKTGISKLRGTKVFIEM